MRLFIKNIINNNIYLIIILLLFLLFFVPNVSFAQKIDKVIFSGNKRIPDTRIQPYLINEGQNLDTKKINASIKNLHGTGLFLNIDTDLYVEGDKFVLEYILEEMPLVGSIIFNGNKEVKTKKLKEDFPITVGSALNFSNLEKALKTIKTKYEDQNRYGTTVSFRINRRTVNSVDLYFDIEERGKSKIHNIYFLGNDNIERSELLKNIPIKEKGFWTLITSSGKISQDMIDYSGESVRNVYLQHGYLDANIGVPELVHDPKKPELSSLYFRIQEGEQYYVRNVSISGYENLPLSELEGNIRFKKGDIFNVRIHQENILRLTSSYTTKGYAYANVEPKITPHRDTREVDVEYVIDESFLVYINKINITGNEKTFDRVIRRQIDQLEGELYNSKLIKEAKDNTMATGYFENVTITEENEARDKVNLNVNVKEQNTGTFTIGAAYSTIDGILGMVQISRNNFMGWGHSVSLRAEVSQKRLDFFLRYTDPYIADWPVSAGFDIFNTQREWYEYGRQSLGGSVRLGHDVIKRRLSLSYRFSAFGVNLYNLDSSASDYVREESNRGNVMSYVLGASLNYHNLDNYMDPTRGNKSSISIDYAGFGGGNSYLKFGANVSHYFPIALDGLLTFLLHGEVGYIHNLAATNLPVDELFRLGGINSIRGHGNGDITPRYKDDKAYGGDLYFQANAELIFPIKPDIKLKGVIFFDIGQSYAINNVDLRSPNEQLPRYSAGLGVRWVTPMGPFRIEWGIKLDRKPGEELHKFDFSIGGTF